MEQSISQDISNIYGLQCDHCALPVITPYTNDQGDNFCCRGCLTVFSIIKNHNLQNYYNIQKADDTPRKAVNRIQEKQYSYLDDPLFLQDYVHYNLNSEATLSFFLEGVHCIACLWLIEKIPTFTPEIKSVRLNFENSVATITLKKEFTLFSKVASALNNLGYPPTPLRSDDEIKKLQQKEERSYLLRIGVAAACMMNIMLYAVGLYAGAQGVIGSAFSFIALVFCIPIVTYCAQPFYTSSIKAIVNGSINIDTPLSIAIVLGFIVSLHNVIIGTEAHYFDSIATLTFLILFSRYLLLKASRHNYQRSGLNSFLTDSSIVRRSSENQLEEIHPSQIRVGDTILISPGSSLPCDGKIIKGSSEISLAILNGESKAKKHHKGMMVFMGTINLGSAIEIEVISCAEETKLGKIYAAADSIDKKKANITLLTDRISKFFVAAVLATSALTILTFIFLGQIESGINRALALIIITCPCALGLATPLTYSRIMNLSAKMGALLKSEYVLEKLSRAKNIFFDKTGTITTGDYRVARVKRIREASAPYSIESIIFSMEANSSHPVALTLIDWAKLSSATLENIPCTNLCENLGKGVTASIDGTNYEIRSSPSDNEFLKIILVEDGKVITEMLLKDTIKDNTASLFEELNSKNYNLFIASGDQPSQVREVAAQLNLNKTNWRSSMSPEEKGEWVEQYPNTLFIGDGVNDTLAFSKSSTSIAVKGSLEVSLSSSEIYLKGSDIELIPHILLMAKAGSKTIKRNLVFSIVYNILGATLALFGILGPLEAAILMPLSSLTVLLSTLWGTRESLFINRKTL